MDKNIVFGKERTILIPYPPDFFRKKAYFCNLFFAASIPALKHFTDKNGYALIEGKLANTGFVLQPALIRLPLFSNPKALTI